MKIIEVYEKNRRIFPPFTLVIRIASWLCRTKEHVKVKKVGRIPKPPYLLISSHASFMDYFTCIKATLPHQPYWISTIEEYIDKDFIFRELGIIPKRKFTNDPKSAQLYLDVLKNKKKILIIYPEARYSFIGQPERFDDGIAKLAKNAGVPICFINNHGHYLRDPQWGDHKIRKVSNMRAEMKCIISKKYIKQLSVEEIDSVIKENFKFNEEQYQLDNNIKITYKKRAEGLEHILYRCPHCGKEFEMSSSGTTLSCDACGAKYNLNEDGTLSCLTGEAKFTKISDWYKWEKQLVVEEVEKGEFFFEDDVRCEHLEGTGIGFVPMKGNFHLTMSINDGIKVSSDTGFEFVRSPLQSYAIHIEFDYHGRGGCLDIASNTETYFVYPLNKVKWLTKIHFANEAIYNHLKNKLKE